MFIQARSITLLGAALAFHSVVGLLSCADPEEPGSPTPAPSDDDSASPSPGDDDNSDDDTTPGDDDATPGDDDATPGDDDDTPPGDDDTPVGPATFESCFGWMSPVMDYAPSGATINQSCLGTNHQSIQAPEHVVFVGDSITVGTPPTATTAWYRNLVAEGLSQRFGLEMPGVDWQNVDLWNGVTYVQDSGPFSSCAKWGARTDDIFDAPHQQLQTCIPEGVRGLRTLVIMTVGGNDLMTSLQDVRDGADDATVQAEWEGAILDLEEAIHWLKDDPTRFPAGVDVIFANIFDVTDDDGASDIGTCPGATLIGLDDPLFTAPVQQRGQLWQQAAIDLAVETGSDMVFLGEQWCGHGYNTSPSHRCYRGAGAANYFDDTCSHPNTAGHQAVADAVLSIIDE